MLGVNGIADVHHVEVASHHAERRRIEAKAEARAIFAWAAEGETGEPKPPRPAVPHTG